MDPASGSPSLPRIHGIEWHELPWVPHFFREGITDALLFGWNYVPLPALAPVHPAAELIAKVFEDSAAVSGIAPGARQLVDLCAGSGGPTPSLTRMVNEQAAAAHRPLRVRATLTDLFPHADVWQRQSDAAGADMVTFHAEPVDATAVPATLPGVRTLMGCFHHFTPALCKQIFASAAETESCEALVVLELSQRYVVVMVLHAVAIGILLLFVPLFFSRFSLPRMAMTYLLPVLPLMGMWDAVVSSWRSYTPEELLAMATEADAQHRMVWTADRKRVIPWMAASEMVHIIGIRKDTK
jgi:hypothetical protein